MTLLTPHSGDEHDIREATAELLDYEPGALRFPRWHRIRALPAVAAIHALRSDLSRDEAEALRGVILQTHHVALKPAEDPHREILQIVWANTIAALIRNLQSWQHFQLGPDLINEAEDVCHRFLAGELMLLHAALHVWQFLLTYDRALADRGNFLDGKLMSPFWRDERRAQDLLNGDLTTLANYGVMPSDWPALRSLAERHALPFSKDALSYLTDLFSQGEATFHQSDFEKQDVARRA